jgi:hypothetical protein
LTASNTARASSCETRHVPPIACDPFRSIIDQDGRARGGRVAGGFGDDVAVDQQSCRSDEVFVDRAFAVMKPHRVLAEQHEVVLTRDLGDHGAAERVFRIPSTLPAAAVHRQRGGEAHRQVGEQQRDDAGNNVTYHFGR